MPFVTVHMWPGRSKEAKAKVIKAITDALTESAGIPAEATQVAIIEVPQENWGIGGVCASERQAHQPHP
jgi:4-oxalocrotonate tautomerase